MLVRVLGSSAGGGFPQWNCNCPNCTGFRSGTLRAHARTQSSICVTANGSDWLLVNASPDILTQIRATPGLQPARASRDSGIAAVLLMDAQIDHVTGLLMLRERVGALPLYATAEVFGDIGNGFPITRILSHYCGVESHDIHADGTRFSIAHTPGVALQAVSLSSKPPPYSPYRERPRAGDNIGLVIENPANGKRCFYAPGLGSMDDTLFALMSSCDVVLVDGTFWHEDEMLRLGLSQKRAADMGHIPQHGPGGLIEHFARLPSGTRRILIHINNTNPILDEDSPERQELARNGIEVACDGMEITL